MTFSFTVPSALAGERLDRILPEAAAGVSRRAARKLILDGAVFVDGRRTKVQSRPLPAGALVEIRALSRPEPLAPLTFARQGDLFVVEKPSGAPSEPTRTAAAGTVAHALRQALVAQGGAPAFLAAVHRLDRETSGVLLFARERAVAAELGALFQEGAVLRRYLALVEGAPAADELVLDAPLVRSPDASGRYRTGEGGRAAVTEATVKVRAPDAALLEVRPLTGRTHQIRVHLAEAGHPVCGDSRYGARPIAPGAFGLHALALGLGSGAGQAAADVVYAARPPESFYELAASRGIPREELEEVARPWLQRAER